MTNQLIQDPKKKKMICYSCRNKEICEISGNNLTEACVYYNQPFEQKYLTSHVCPNCDMILTWYKLTKEGVYFDCNICGYCEVRHNGQFIRTIGTTKTISLKVSQSSKTQPTIDLALKLTTEFKKINFVGIKQLDKLITEYKNLNTIFDTNINIDSALINVSKVRGLTTDIYNQGLSLLNSVLTFAQQLANTNIEELINEQNDLNKQVVNVSGKLSELVHERLSKISSSLRMIKSYQDKCDELLCEVDLCVDSIREIRLQLPELMSRKPKEEFDKVVLELGSRIEYAQRLNEEYKRQGI